LLLARDTIGDFTDGPLANYVGLAPYVERADFEEWLALISEDPRTINFQQWQPQPSTKPTLDLMPVEGAVSRLSERLEAG
jgi:hypothetical protein